MIKTEFFRNTFQLFPSTRDKMKLFLIFFTTFVVVCESALDIKFRFFGVRYTDSKLIKYGDDISLIVGTQYFDPKKASVFITHGYSFYLQSRGAKPLIDAHIQNDDDINVVYIDWTAYTNKKVTLNHEQFDEVTGNLQCSSKFSIEIS